MKIVSNFKDYYDFVSHQFGGGDPNCVYERINNRLTGVTDTVYKLDIRRLGYRNIIDHSFRWIFIAGKCYFFVSKKPNPFLTERGDDYEANLIFDTSHPKYKSVQKDRRNVYYPFGKQELFFGAKNNGAILISKKIKQPVFEFSVKGVVSPTIPILGKTNITHYIDPYQMYQNLEVYMNNVINDKTDLNPPVELDEKVKIEKHGFDLKTSFRHRK